MAVSLIKMYDLFTVSLRFCFDIAHEQVRIIRYYNYHKYHYYNIYIASKYRINSHIRLVPNTYRLSSKMNSKEIRKQQEMKIMK